MPPWRLVEALPLAERGGRHESVPLDQPSRVVCFSEREQREAQFFDRFEVPHPERIFFQRADEPLGAGVSHGRRTDAPRQKAVTPG